MRRDYHSMHIGYLGTYASPKSAGIYRFSLNPDTGVLTPPELYCPGADCKYLSLRGSLLAAPIQGKDQAGICLFDISKDRAALLGVQYKEERTACYVTQDGAFLYSANYHEGTALIYEKTGQGLTLYKRIEIAPGAGCHQILFHGSYLMVNCLLLDQIQFFDRTKDYAAAGVISLPKGSGPRHGVFTRDHGLFFLVGELDNCLYVYRPADRLDWELLGVYPLLESSEEGEDGSISTPAPAAAAIRLSPDERYVYVSIRFADVLCVYSIENGRLRRVQRTGSGGKGPRDFVITKDGSFLLAANRTEGGLVCFPLDRESGRIGSACSRTEAPEAVSIVLEPYIYIIEGGITDGTI